jgi:hypothetical protein
MALLSGSSDYRSLIISMSEAALREGINLQKGMNFRDDVQPAVFLVLEREDGFHDRWDAERSLFVYQGHDSIAEGSRAIADDQLLMYESGKPTDNGKFYKAAHAYKDGVRQAPLQVQVYEKLDAGVFFDKGIFNLVDAAFDRNGGRKVATFLLTPADAGSPAPSWSERMIDPAQKAYAWRRYHGRCAICAGESGLHFVRDASAALVLACELHENLTAEDATIRV